MSTPPTTTLGKLAIPVALWSIPALLMVLQMQASAFVDHRPLYAFRDTVPAIVEWLVWVPVTPLVLALARRFPVWPNARPRAILVHAGGVVAATLLRGSVYSLTTFLVGRFPRTAFAPYFVRIAFGWLPSAALVYGAIVLAGVALHYANQVADGQVRTAELETAVARAESATLRAQLDPHFLFNSLHSIGALVRANQATGAVQMLSDLGALLRESLARRDSDQSTLADELDFARRYLSIEQVRFQDRLVVEWDVDVQTRTAIVPRLILQPLVENAIRHGIAKRSAAGRVAISVRRDNERIVITVVDDGAGIRDDTTLMEGIGLSATRARLDARGGSLTLRGRDGGGVSAEIRLPLVQPATT